MATISAADFLDIVIGLPYDAQKFHCWECARRCQKMVFDRDIPPIIVRPDNMRDLVDMMAQRKTFYGWKEVADPEHGAVVFMTKNGHEVSRAACHAGVWLDLDGGGILHTDEGHGVVFESLLMIQQHNWGDFSYYVPDPEAT